MLPIPPELQAQFEEHLAKRLIPNGLHGVYKKWLRYYLDFCQKYRFPPTYTQSLPRFIKKLQEKKQTKAQQEQAVTAITLYYEVLKAKGSPNKEPLRESTHPPRYAPFNGKKRFSIREPSVRPVQYEKGTPPVSRSLPTSAPVRNLPKADPSTEKKNAGHGIGASWKAEYARLVDEIKVRHYSPKTLQTYRGWVQHFSGFLAQQGSRVAISG